VFEPFFTTKEAVLTADAAGDEILQKPFKLDALTAAVVRLIERTRRQHGNVIDYPSNAASRTLP